MEDLGLLNFFILGVSFQLGVGGCEHRSFSLRE